MSTHDPLLDATLTGLKLLDKAICDALAVPTKPAQSVQDPADFALCPPTTLSQKQFGDYLRSGGTKCPICGCESLDGGSIDIDAGCAYQNITCTDCGSEWTDEYELTGLSNFTCGLKGGDAIES